MGGAAGAPECWTNQKNKRSNGMPPTACSSSWDDGVRRRRSEPSDGLLIQRYLNGLDHSKRSDVTDDGASLPRQSPSVDPVCLCLCLFGGIRLKCETGKQRQARRHCRPPLCIAVCVLVRRDDGGGYCKTAVSGVPARHMGGRSDQIG
jgi:hypothetical protein